jgi:hypothetical protein
MTNKQLKAHCEEVIANPQDHPDWVVDMAIVALASLDAVPVGRVNRGAVSESNEYPEARVNCIHEHADWENFQDGFLLYTAPPAPELKPIKLPNCVDDLHGIGPVISAEAVEKAIRDAGYEVKS